MKSSAQARVHLSLASASLAAYDPFSDSWSYYAYYDNLTSGVRLSCPSIIILAAPQTYRLSMRGCHLRQPDSCRPAAAHIHEPCRQCYYQSRQYDVCAHNEKRNTVIITPNDV